MFTTKEIAALRVIANLYAMAEGEDIIGIIMKTGAFHWLGDQDAAVVALAHKLAFEYGKCVHGNVLYPGACKECGF